MKLKWLGHSSFLLVASDGTSVVTDPYSGIGMAFPSVRADAVTVSHSHTDHNNVKGVGGDPKVFSTSGEHRIGSVGIYCFEASHDERGGARRGKTLVTLFEIDGHKVCHMGDIGEPCSELVANKIGHVDILLIPVGGTYTVTAEGAKEYVRRLAPNVVIPMHYKEGGCTLDIQGVDSFAALFNVEDVVCVRSDELNEDDIDKFLSSDTTRVIIFKRS